MSADSKQQSKTILVGTRKSKLAIAQTELVVGLLRQAWPTYSFHVQPSDSAAGDVDKVTSFKDMPVKNLWTHDLEQSMLAGHLDILVHSLKGESRVFDWSALPAYLKRRSNAAATKLCNWGDRGARKSPRCIRAQAWSRTM